MNREIKKYKYNGARSLVLLHEEHLTNFLRTWQKAKSLRIELPRTDDPDYQSLESLLFHVLRSARGYMTWICEKLNLPDPEINNPPEINEIENNSEKYLNHLFERWCLPLTEIEEVNFHNPVYKSRWGVEYCIDAMLEHAVMHPIRHEFQLKNLIIQQNLN
ncbi:MAG: hypothetical protein HYS24_14140 [Ignavibacteriales bacterium]|jgi:hypothetical protein|nr:hypothetical protein [Ignavibacteriales bacterium]